RPVPPLSSERQPVSSVTPARVGLALHDRGVRGLRPGSRPILATVGKIPTRHPGSGSPRRCLDFTGRCLYRTNPDAPPGSSRISVPWVDAGPLLVVHRGQLVTLQRPPR